MLGDTVLLWWVCHSITDDMRPLTLSVEASDDHMEVVQTSGLCFRNFAMRQPWWDEMSDNATKAQPVSPIARDVGNGRVLGWWSRGCPGLVSGCHLVDPTCWVEGLVSAGVPSKLLFAPLLMCIHRQWQSMTRRKIIVVSRHVTLEYWGVILTESGVFYALLWVHDMPFTERFEAHCRIWLGMSTVFLRGGLLHVL
jgi:hypothetical protein